MLSRGPALGVFWLCLASAAAADPAAPATLHLANEGTVPGRVQGAPDDGVLHWRSPLFSQALRFPLSAVRGVHYAAPAVQPEPTGAYCFELAGDDVLFGDLVGLTRDEVEVDAARVGRVHLRRDQIGRFYLWKGADAVYLGPRGLTGWKDAAATPQWRDEGGHLVTDHDDASLFGDLGIPPKAVIEFELSWKKKPDFQFALGVSEKETAVQRAFRFEVWDDDLVAVGESEKDADVASVAKLGPGEGRVRVQVYLDQEQRQMQLLSRNGKPLATLKIATAKKREVHPGVRLTNRKGDVRLEHFRVTRWNGVPPRPAREDQARLRRTDGTVITGQLTAYDPKLKQFTVRDGDKETLVPHDAVADVFLSPTLYAPPAPPGAPAGVPADKPARTLRVAYHDGTWFSGRLTRIEDTHVSLTSPDVKEPLRLPLDGVRSLIVLGGGDAPAAPAATEGRAGRLEMEGTLLKGHLIPGSEQPGASCLVWQADLALNASPMVPGVAGRIVYKDPPPPVKMPDPRNGRFAVAVPAGGGAVARAAPAARVDTDQWRPPSQQTRRALHLRSGDTIPCEVSRIDEKGVTFKTSLSDATFVPNDKVKSVELVATKDAPRLARTKRERLLTLPRMQRDSPPTHLICSKTGDILRGRILEMDDKVLRVEVRLETREIPRERVGQIIWLHADELTPAKPAEAGPAAVQKITRVQTLRAPGNRLTFVAQKLEGGTLSGVSDVLGPCHAELADVDELLFGPFIEQSAAKLAYHLWKLHYATEPKYVQAGAGGSGEGGATGTESPLVGQAAYSFNLDLLDGKKFHLADRKGHVVVLDFWATWCGPCMQSMPLVDGVVREFADKGVELIAVNMEEQPEQIKAMLERHKLKVTVALDRDGVVAAKYAVTAIPQTVIIDKEGKVARLFVGGGQGTADALKKALQELSDPKPAPPPAPPQRQ
jgi:thiol-disulfide isomerase/thioredoxin